MLDRRRLALGIALVGLAAIAVSPLLSIVRDPTFHEYGGPRALLVGSNAAFVVAALLAPRSPWYLRVAVAAIGVGSAGYHLEPGDLRLALDFGPIVIALSLVTAHVLADRTASRAAFVIGPLVAVGSVAWWIAGGGTEAGGNMAPYVTVQLVGVVLPLAIALAAPGSTPTRWLVVALVGFAGARAANLVDHSAKHVVAAIAAYCALRATNHRREVRH